VLRKRNYCKRSTESRESNVVRIVALLHYSNIDKVTNVCGRNVYANKICRYSISRYSTPRYILLQYNLNIEQLIIATRITRRKKKNVNVVLKMRLCCILF